MCGRSTAAPHPGKIQMRSLVSRYGRNPRHGQLTNQRSNLSNLPTVPSSPSHRRRPSIRKPPRPPRKPTPPHRLQLPRLSQRRSRMKQPRLCCRHGDTQQLRRFPHRLLLHLPEFDGLPDRRPQILHRRPNKHFSLAFCEPFFRVWRVVRHLEVRCVFSRLSRPLDWQFPVRSLLSQRHQCGIDPDPRQPVEKLDRPSKR